MRARSPFTIPLVILGFLGFALLNAWTDYYGLFRIEAEAWRLNIPFYENIRYSLIAFSILWVGLTGTLAWLQYRLANGWEPRQLERLIPAATVVAAIPAGDAGSIEVRRQNGEVETYLCEPHEFAEFMAGDVIHLWVIGPYVSRHRLLARHANPATPDMESISAYWNRRISNTTTSFTWRSWLAYGIASAVGGLLFYQGVIWMLTREISRVVDNYDESYATVYPPEHSFNWGMGAMVVSLAILVAIIVYWRIGFSDESLGLDQIGDGDDSDWSTRIR
ncbi:MAG: hypothetical protein SFX74_01680 [Fimbriimonadaceae bacterium]|nr:hypothetical protein [Fimbriimonadaceae bacterium]